MSAERDKSGQPAGKQQVMEAILDATVELVGQHGFAGLSLRDVASRAGVAYGLIYRHFGTKTQLVLQARHQARTKIFGSLTGPGDNRPPTDPAYAVVSALLDQPELSRFMARMLCDAGADPEFQTTAADALWSFVDARTKATIYPPGADPKATFAARVALVMGWLLLEQTLFDGPLSGYEPAHMRDAIASTAANTAPVKPGETTSLRN